MTINFDELRREINNISAEDMERQGVITPARKKAYGKPTYICPFCGNGEGKSGDGLAVNPKDWGFVGYTCFGKCGGKTYNNLQLLSHYYGINDGGKDSIKLLKRACDDFGIYFPVEDNQQYKTKTNKHTATPAKTDEKLAQEQEQKEQSDLALQNLIVSDIEKARANFGKFPLAEKRGLTDETLNQFQVGVDFNWTPPKTRLEENQKLFPSPRVIIPHLPNSALPEFEISYCAAMFLSERKIKGDDFKYLYGGNRIPFGLNLLTLDAEIILVTEGEFDALSIWQSLKGKYPCLATGGTAFNEFFDVLSKFYPKNKPKIIPVADNDSAGKKFADDLCAECIIYGFAVVSIQFNADDKPKLDANAILREQGDVKLAEMLNSLIADKQTDLQQISTKIKNGDVLTFDNYPVTLEFIKNSSRRDFISLYNQKTSKERNEKIIKIIKHCLEEKTRKGKKVIFGSASNVENIFNADPYLEKLFGYEKFSFKTVFLRQPFWRQENYIEETLNDTDAANIRLYIRKTYTELIKDKTIQDFILVVGNQNSFHVVKQFFDNLPNWDGKARAETLFIDFLKVEDTPFARAVTIKWLLAAVARIFYPGCDFQAAIVLQGEQGIGKGFILQKLGGKWYKTLSDNLDDRHVLDTIQKGWIFEMKEFAAGRKADVNRIKAVIDASADTYRTSYAHHAETFKRHCVFSISINDKQFLRDVTGNRRFWILESQLEKFCYVEENRDGEKLTDNYIQQIWAEVFYKFKELTKDGFNDKILELPFEFKAQAEKIADKFMTDDGLQKEIPAFLDIPILPLILWNLLTREEKHKFFTKNFIELEYGDWDFRRKMLKTEEEKQEFDNAISEKNKTVRSIEKKFGNDSILSIAVYGSYTRQETCASEICNEFFGSNNRKQINRIKEILDQLDDWELVEDDENQSKTKQIKNFNGYGNQKNIYRRINATDFSEDEKIEHSAVVETPHNFYTADNDIDLPF